MVTDLFWVDLNSAFSVAIPLAQTSEVLAIAATELCPVPGIKPALRGVSNQRGQLLWVVDLNYLLDQPLPQRQSERLVSVVLVQDKWRVAGVVAKLNGIISLDLEVELPPTDQPCLRGYALVEGRSVGILDVAAVFQALQAPNPSSISPLLALN